MNQLNKDPFIKIELKDYLNRANLIQEIFINKKEHMFLFCPKCLKLQEFKKIPFIDHLTGEESIIYQCNKCKKNWVEEAWNPPNDIRRLIEINHLISPYQTNIQIISFDEVTNI